MRAQTRPGIARGTDIREVTHQAYGKMANGSRITKMDWRLRAPRHPIELNIHLYSVHRQSVLCNLINSFMYNAK